MKMSRFFLFCLSLFLFANVEAATYNRVEDVPNTRLSSNEIHVSDPDDWISPEYEGKINGVLCGIRSEADVFVVVLSSIGDQNIERFATELFNYWGIGEASSNNGVLMLMVEDQHKLRFETGYGVESVLTDALCYRIFTEVIVPYFKQGDYSQGLYEGVCTVAGVFGQLPEDATVTQSQIEELETIQPAKRNSIFSDFGFTEWIVMIGYLLGSIVLYFVHISSLKKACKSLESDDEKEVENAYKTIQKDERTLLVCLLLCTPVFLLLPFYWIVATINKRKNRHRKRVCSCGQEMRCLSEAEEDAYLTENQIFEEDLKVKDYDVWYCESCHNKIVIGYLKNKASRFYTCPSCHCLAGKNQRDTVVVPATELSTGKGLHHVLCKKCGYEFTVSYVIPKVSKSSGGSSGGGGGGGGGSFGGGSSGGGGYTGSW